MLETERHFLFVPTLSSAGFHVFDCSITFRMIGIWHPNSPPELWVSDKSILFYLRSFTVWPTHEWYWCCWRTVDPYLSKQNTNNHVYDWEHCSSIPFSWGDKRYAKRIFSRYVTSLTDYLYQYAKLPFVSCHMLNVVSRSFVYLFWSLTFTHCVLKYKHVFFFISCYLI